jgi:hypothetical protein
MGYGNPVPSWQAMILGVLICMFVALPALIVATAFMVRWVAFLLNAIAP